jgi:hypothetical protein
MRLNIHLRTHHRHGRRHQQAAHRSHQLLSELAHTPSELVVMIGTWLVAAPMVLGHDSLLIPFAGFNDVLVGLVLVGSALLRVLLPAETAPLSLLNLLLGGWLIAAPFIRGYQGVLPATVNDVTVGAVVIVLALASWRSTRSPKNLRKS